MPFLLFPPQQIDQDGDGYILRSELRRYLLATPVSEVPLSDDMVDAMLYHVDYNNDGFINLQEFYGLVGLLWVYYSQFYCRSFFLFYKDLLSVLWFFPNFIIIC